MTVKLWGDTIYVLIIILNTIHSLFQLFVQYVVYLFIFLFMKLTHIQMFKKRMHETRIKCFCLQADTLFSLLTFCMFRYSYNKIYTN